MYYNFNLFSKTNIRHNFLLSPETFSEIMKQPKNHSKFPTSYEILFHAEF